MGSNRDSRLVLGRNYRGLDLVGLFEAWPSRLTRVMATPRA